MLYYHFLVIVVCWGWFLPPYHDMFSVMNPFSKECTGFTTASTPSVNLPAPVVLNDNVDAASIPPAEIPISNLYTNSSTNTMPSDQITLVSNPETNMSSSTEPSWNRANLEQKLRRIDLDLLPKVCIEILEY